MHCSQADLSAVQPTLMTLTVMYYRREEHPLVISWWYCQQGVQLGVAGLLAFGLTYLQNAPIYPWQALFIVVGGLTVIWGVLILIFLPDSPMRAKVRLHRAQADYSALTTGPRPLSLNVSE